MNSFAQTDSLAFGDKEWISNGLHGKLYFLSVNTDSLPDFDTMKVQGNLYAKKIDVPIRSWTTGFPGVPDRNEWFAIVYKGAFQVKKPGRYNFRLMSDDGAKLYIDKKVIVDNDGVHGPGSRIGEALLDNSKHTIRLEYFQGPKTEIALQLFATFEKETEEVFPGTNFILTTPAKKNSSWLAYLLYIVIALLLILVLLAWWRRRSKSRIKKD
jgi:hypothetical protein